MINESTRHSKFGQYFPISAQLVYQFLILGTARASHMLEQAVVLPGLQLSEDHMCFLDWNGLKLHTTAIEYRLRASLELILSGFIAYKAR